VGDWGNQELAWYTNRSDNVRVDNGSLVLAARAESGAGLDWVVQNCWDECRDRCVAQGWTGAQLQYCIDPCGSPRCEIVRQRALTSARVRTYGKFSVAPSAAYATIRVEAGMQLPQGAGLWPAFWMLPERGATDFCSGCGMYGTWASSGEIDIMEAVNEMPDVLGTVHYGGPAPANAYKSGSTPLGAAAAAGTRQYAVEWEAAAMRWYLDGSQYHAAASAASAAGGWFTTAAGAGAAAPFDVPFHLIINLAVGGTLPSALYQQATGKALDLGTVQAAVGAGGKELRVDYVRVCGKAAAGA
jgi:beta-glucanase (GH16 family)